MSEVTDVKLLHQIIFNRRSGIDVIQRLEQRMDKTCQRHTIFVFEMQRLCEIGLPNIFLVCLFRLTKRSWFNNFVGGSSSSMSGRDYVDAALTLVMADRSLGSVKAELTHTFLSVSAINCDTEKTFKWQKIKKLSNELKLRVTKEYK